MNDQTQPTTPITVVIVDDHELVRRGLKGILGSCDDIELVGEARDGETAVALCAARQPDVVLMDMIMPGRSGGETFDRLLQLHPGVRVVLASGYSVNGQAREILDRGCRGFIQKPFHLEKLSRKLREVLDGGAAPPAHDPVADS